MGHKRYRRIYHFHPIPKVLPFSLALCHIYVTQHPLHRLQKKVLQDVFHCCFVHRHRRKVLETNLESSWPWGSNGSLLLFWTEWLLFEVAKKLWVRSFSDCFLKLKMTQRKIGVESLAGTFRTSQSGGFQTCLLNFSTMSVTKQWRKTPGTPFLQLWEGNSMMK